MKRNIFSFSFVLAASVGLVACSGTPSCDDSSVIKKATESVLESVKDQMVASSVLQMSGVGVGKYRLNDNYADMKKLAETDAIAKQLIEQVDKGVSNLSIDLSEIRPLLVDDKVKKSTCQAQVAFVGPEGSGKMGIKYSAQRTNDGLVIEILD